MNLTDNDIRRIIENRQSELVRLPKALVPVTGDESIPVIQDNLARRVCLRELLCYFSKRFFINVNQIVGKDSISFDEAVNAVKDAGEGTVITFYNGNIWNTLQLRDGKWVEFIQSSGGCDCEKFDPSDINKSINNLSTLYNDIIKKIASLNTTITNIANGIPEPTKKVSVSVNGEIYKGNYDNVVTIPDYYSKKEVDDLLKEIKNFIGKTPDNKEYEITVNDIGTGNVVSSISAKGHTINVTHATVSSSGAVVDPSDKDEDEFKEIPVGNSFFFNFNSINKLTELGTFLIACFDTNQENDNTLYVPAYWDEDGEWHESELFENVSDVVPTVLYSENKNNLRVRKNYNYYEQIFNGITNGVIAAKELKSNYKYRRTVISDTTYTEYHNVYYGNAADLYDRTGWTEQQKYLNGGPYYTSMMIRFIDSKGVSRTVFSTYITRPALFRRNNGNIDFWAVQSPKNPSFGEAPEFNSSKTPSRRIIDIVKAKGYDNRIDAKCYLYQRNQELVNAEIRQHSLVSGIAKISSRIGAFPDFDAPSTTLVRCSDIMSSLYREPYTELYRDYDITNEGSGWQFKESSLGIREGAFFMVFNTDYNKGMSDIYRYIGSKIVPYNTMEKQLLPTQVSGKIGTFTRTIKSEEFGTIVESYITLDDINLGIDNFKVAVLPVSNSHNAFKDLDDTLLGFLYKQTYVV